MGVVAFSLFTLISAPADAQPSAPGEFRLTTGRLRAEVADWGPDCGPRPTDAALPTGLVYRLTDGGTLSSARPDAPPLFAPGICRAITGQPELTEQLQGATARCRSGPDAAKQITGEVRVRFEGPDLIRVSQRVEYRWALRGSTCLVTTVTRADLSRTVPTAAPAPTPPEPVLARCAAPGPAVALKLRGSARRAVRQGGRLALAVSTLDAEGCATPSDVAFAASVGRVSGAGLFDATGLSPGAVATITVNGPIGVEPVTVRVEVVGDADLAALAAAEPELLDGEGPALPPQASTLIGDARSGDADDAGSLGPALIGLVGALAVLMAALGVWIVVRSTRDRRDSARTRVDAQQAMSEARRRTKDTEMPTVPRTSGGVADPSGSPSPQARSSLGAPGAGPATGRPSREGSARSGRDDARDPSDASRSKSAGSLAPAAGVSLTVAGFPPEQARSPGPGRCPRCARTFRDGTRFCPEHGLALVAVEETHFDDLATSTDAPRVVAADADSGDRICPRCGRKYTEDTAFCVEDGRRLVLIN